MNKIIKTEEIMDDSLFSTKHSLAIAEEILYTGEKTLDMLYFQGDQLKKINDKFDNTNNLNIVCDVNEKPEISNQASSDPSDPINTNIQLKIDYEIDYKYDLLMLSKKYQEIDKTLNQINNVFDKLNTVSLEMNNELDNHYDILDHLSARMNKIYLTKLNKQISIN